MVYGDEEKLPVQINMRKILSATVRSYMYGSTKEYSSITFKQMFKIWNNTAISENHFTL